ncbi:hypothetical protein, partial [Microbacterium sp.]|uniref:hypothetical protein n=1 Tax=Microbacterium sp. TaxID=51671 RepID=UPI0028A94204
VVGAAPGWGPAVVGRAVGEAAVGPDSAAGGPAAVSITMNTIPAATSTATETTATLIGVDQRPLTTVPVMGTASPRV